MSTQRERSRGAPRPTRASQLLRRAAASPRQTSLQWPPSAAEPQRGRAPAPLVAAGPPASPAAVAPPAGPAAVDPPVVTVAVDSPVASASDTEIPLAQRFPLQVVAAEPQPTTPPFWAADCPQVPGAYKPLEARCARVVEVYSRAPDSLEAALQLRHLRGMDARSDLEAALVTCKSTLEHCDGVLRGMHVDHLLHVARESDLFFTVQRAEKWLRWCRQAAAYNVRMEAQWSQVGRAQ